MPKPILGRKLTRKLYKVNDKAKQIANNIILKPAGGIMNDATLGASALASNVALNTTFPHVSSIIPKKFS